MSLRPHPVLKLRGKYTFPSEISEAPDGALSKARNISIDQESVATPRRGFDKGFSLPLEADRLGRLTSYKSSLIAFYNGTTLGLESGGTVSPFSGSFAAPDATTPLRFAEANQNLYFTSSAGTKKLDSLSATPKNAGAPKGLTIEGAVTGTSGFLDIGNGTGNAAVAYRAVWGYTDANNNLILGAPSQRYVVSNSSGGARDVALTVTVPAGVTTDYIYQIYRSPNTTSADAEPTDELQLCYEANPTAGEISAGTVSFTDSLPEDLLGATIYTAPSQEGIGASNEAPPLARDVTVFKGHMFYLGTRSRHRKQLTILSVGSSGDTLQAGDVITVAGVSFTAAAATNVAANEFKVFTAGSISQNIRDTALELVKVINQSTTNTGADAVYAYYVSGYADTPGKIMIECRSVGGAQFALTYTQNSHTGNPFNPQLPSSGTSVSSSNDDYKNGLYFSKHGQPEAVPLPNFFRVGSADDEALRIIPLRDSLFILKEKDGVYRLTGEDAGSFRVEEFDATARIIGPESAVKLNNAIYFLSDQGVVECTETGISVISRPIEDEFLALFSLGNVAKLYSFAVGYETERKYILGVPSASTDTGATKFHVYNTFTRAWTEWDGISAVSGFVSPIDDKLYLALSDESYVYEERKERSNTDFADFRSDETISDVTGLTLTISSADEIEVGDIIYQSSSVFSVVESVDAAAGTATVRFDGGLVAGAATVYRAIDCEIEWVPVHAGTPFLLKQIPEVALMFKQNFALEAELAFASEVSLNYESVDLDGSSFGLFGFFPFGSVPFGGAVGRQPERTYVPAAKQYCTQLSVRFRHRIGFSAFKLNGMVAWVNDVSERFSR